MWPFKNTKSEIEKNIGKVHRMYLFATIAVIALFFSGGGNYIISNVRDTLYMSIGLLTFVSIFFSLVYSSSITKMEEKFLEALKKVEQNIKDKFTKEMDSKGLLDISESLEPVETLKKRVYPQKHLFISIIAYLTTIIATLINPNNPLVNQIAKYVSAGLFHIGLLFTMFLIFSIMAISVIKFKE